MRKILSFSFIFAILLAASASAQTSHAEEEQKHTATRQLMQVVGTAGLLQQILDQTIDQQVATMRRLRPDISDSFWDHFSIEFKHDANPQELIDLMVPIYEKHFSQDEIQQLVSFYSTPLGKKISTTLPEIQGESLEAGKQWGAKIAKRLEERMNQEMEDEKSGKKPSEGLQQN
jgi:uncharacterized protein